MQRPFRIVFMGTPDFAAHILQALCNWDACEVAGVYCQPDRPAGRGKKLQAPAVKVVANQYNIPVYQPLNFKSLSDVEQLKSLKPDFLVVAAYGLILPQCVLDIPTIAPLNVHGSLLPFYRGAAPIQRAIMDGQLISGVSIMKMEAGLDTGPVYAMKSLDISSHTAGQLHEELSSIGSSLLIKVMTDIVNLNLLPTPQDDAQATYASKLSKIDGLINFNCLADTVHAKIRGVTPWPGAQISILRPENDNLDVRIGPGHIGSEVSSIIKNLGNSNIVINPGQFWLLDKNVLAISTIDKFYILNHVRPMNKSQIAAADFARGYLFAKQPLSGPLAIVKAD